MIRRFTVVFSRVFLFLSLAAGTVFAQDAATPARISVSESNCSTVSAVVYGNVADLILVGAGYDDDFCAGARCRIERHGVPVAEIVLASADRNRSVGLIIDLKNNQTILTGDTVRLKTI